MTQMTIDTIDSFTGKYAFLSNFYASEVRLGGQVALTVEHAFQAAKAVRYADRLKILDAPTPTLSKRYGRRVMLRDDWEDIKLWVMEDLLRQKFRRQDLKRSLLATGDATLIEGNWWGDEFWGVCEGKGENNLGKLLMTIREDIQTHGA